MKIGSPLHNIPKNRSPMRRDMTGRLVTVTPIDPDRHCDDLYNAACGRDGDSTGEIWTYMSFGPFSDKAEFQKWLKPQDQSDDPLVFAIIDRADGRALGMASYLRIVPQWATCEIGSIWFSPSLMRTSLATEAMYLMASHVFEDLGYRRYEWKCDSLNEASCSAALRLGFQYEGLFRQHMIYKGRNRDTSWFAMTDMDWPIVKAAFEFWLAEENFDDAGRQRKSLAAIRESFRPS